MCAIIARNSAVSVTLEMSKIMKEGTRFQLKPTLKMKGGQSL